MNIVTAAVIVHDEKILLAQRKAGSYMEFKWEFPGGKMEEGETPEQCLIREIKEELGMTIEIENIYLVVPFKYKERDIVMLTYTCKLIEGEGERVDCEDFRWVTRKELDSYDYPPPDLPVVEKLKQDKDLF